MLWRAADELFAAGEFRDSLTLFETSKRIQFGAIDLQNQQILTRRIADCQLKLGNAAAARNAIIAALEATSRHPSSLRLLFEADLQQGKLDECRNVIAEIAASADTAETVSALGHVASIASQHISGADLVSAAIQSLIQVHRDRSLPISSKFLPLYRKLIKINQDSSANEEAAAMINADLFGEVAAICADNDLQPTEEEQLEVLLLAKWAWNAAVALQGADTDIVARAFDIASTLLERARAMAPVSDAKDFWQRSLASIVATAAACVRHARVTSDEASRKDALEAALDRVQKFKEAAAQSPFRDVSPAEDALGSQLLLIEFEARLALFQYAELQVFLTSIGEDVHWTTLELMTDLALRSDKTPSGIQFLVIQVTLDAILRQDEIDSSKFATWMRVLIVGS